MNDTTTTLRQRKIYTLLINPRNPRNPLTQAEVARLLELKRERVSEGCKALEEKGFIRRLGDGYNNITYRRGPKAPIIEAQIAASYLEDGEWFDCYGLAFRPPQLAGGPGYENYCSVWRTHLNGGWIQFTVLTEGDLHHVDWHDGKREIRQQLFPERPSGATKGQVNYHTSLNHEGAWVQLRYQRTANVKHLYMIPGDLRQTDAELDDSNLDPFMIYCYPILAWLEKWGGWKFKKHPQSNQYEYKAEVRKEFGADPLTSRILAENVGTNFGIPGKTPIWLDGSVPGGEAETNSAEYAHYLSNLPAHLKSLQHQIDELTRIHYQTLMELTQRQVEILQALDRQVSIAEIQTSSRPITTADEPPEGYQ